MTTRKLLSLAAAALLFIPTSVLGQSIFAGFGGTFPTGEYGDEDQTAADTGWMGIAGVSFALGSQLDIYGEGFYGENKHSDGNEKTNPYGAMAGLLYNFSDNPDAVGVYVFGGAGLMVHKFVNDDDTSQNDSESKFGYQAGAGVGIPLGGALSLFGEGRFMGATETTFFGAFGGVSIALGSS
jgi:opacity protein-like surface antigen